MKKSYEETTIKQLRISYQIHKMRTKVPKSNLTLEDIKISNDIVYRIEYIIDNLLDTKERLILKKDLIDKEDSEWFYKYMTRSSYYRLRKQAYHKFIQYLDK